MNQYDFFILLHNLSSMDRSKDSYRCFKPKSHGLWQDMCCIVLSYVVQII